MNSFLALRQLLTVGDLFAASALIMALAWLAPYRKTASLRHLAWVAGFGALLLLPLLLAIVPSLRWRTWPFFSRMVSCVRIAV